MLKQKPLLPAILTATLVIGFSARSHAQERQKAGRRRQEGGAGDGDGAQQYCANVVNIAADARIAWEMKRLDDIETQVKQQIAELAAKEAESQGVDRQARGIHEEGGAMTSSPSTPRWSRKPPPRN